MTATGYNPSQTNTGNTKYGFGSGQKAPKGYNKFQQFTPEQMELFQQLFSHIAPGSYLSKLAGGDEDIFNEVEAPALRQFSALQGNIASNFSGAGMGARRSSGFQNTMNQAGSEFAQGLQSQRQQLQRQALMDMMGISNSLLGQQPYGLAEKPQKQPGFWEQVLGGGANALSSMGPMYFAKQMGLF